MHRWICFLFGIAAYAFGMGSLVLFILFVGGWTKLPGGVELPWHIDTQSHGPIGSALLVNFALVALFGIQHSIMARPGFKRVWTRIIPRAIERSCYCVATGAVICLLVVFWQPMAGAVWSFESSLLRIALTSLQIIGWSLVVASSFMINHFELFGLQQTYYRFVNREEPEPTFTVRYFYRFVRHPLQLGVLIGIWATPHMSTAHMLLSAMMTAYIIIGLCFEERDLVDSLGQDYEQYRSRVNMLWPIPMGRKRVVDLAMIALVVHLTLNSGLNTAHADTHDWNDPTGGVYGTFTKWTPVGLPTQNDTTRFLQSGNYTVSFLQSRQVDTAHILDGSVTFESAGFAGDRTYAAETATVALGSELFIKRGANGNNFTLSTSDTFAVRGTMNVDGGAQLDNTDAVVSSLVNNSVGQVFVRGIGAGDRSRWKATSLLVGDTKSGAVRVDGGGFVQIDGLAVLGSQSGSDGELVVSGRTPSNTASDFRAVGGITIGDSGNGDLRVENGAKVSSDGTILGNEAAGRGMATVENNVNTNPSFLFAGVLNVKRGDVVVNSGGALRTTAASIGGNATSSVTVSGAGSGLEAGVWEAYGSTTVGSSANGTLDIEQGGRVLAVNTGVGRFAGGVGRINVSSSNPALKSQWLQTGNLNLGENSSGPGGVGHLNLNTNSFARVDGTTTIYANSSVVMGPNSTLLAPTIDNSNGGFFDFLRGTLHTKTFTGNLINQEGTLAPYRSSSPVGEGAGDTFIQGNYTQQSGATLAIDVGGITCGISYDHVEVTGIANLGGALELSMLPGFTPSPSNTMTILSAGSLLGTFDNISPGGRLDTIDGLGSFLVNYGAGSPFSATSIVLSDFESLVGYPGDYDFDEDVDGADFLEWQRTDGSASGLADWEMNYGTLAPALTASQAVPEPASILLLVLGTLALAVARRPVREKSVERKIPVESERSGRGSGRGSAASVTFIPLILGAMLAGTIGSHNAHAQVTRNWINPAGGHYNSFINWSPAFSPLPDDTARFNILTTPEVPIAILNDVTAAELQIVSGDLFFNGAGANTTKMVNYGTATIESEGELTIQHWVADINVNISNELDVFGDLSVLNGSRLISGDATVDSPDDATTASVALKGSNPSGDSSFWETPSLLVGLNHFGNLNVEDGANVQLGELILGDGDVVIDGVGPDGSPSTISATRTIEIGRFGTGTVRVLNGAVFSTRGVILGPFGSTSSGSVVLDGQDALGNPSRWDAPAGLLMDQGNITISGGAQFSSGGTSLTIGTLEVTDPDSAWTTTEVLRIGHSGDSLVNVKAGAQVSSDTVFLGSFADNIGQIILTSLTSDAISTWTSSSDMFVGGNQTGARGDGHLQLVGNARVDVAGTMKIWQTGTVLLSTSSTLIADTIVNTDGGDFDFAHGILQANLFVGDLVNKGGTLTPGGSDAGVTSIFGDYTQQPDATLSIDIGGTTPGTSYDVLSTGLTLLDGQLDLNLINGFAPSGTDEFTILAASNLFESFDNVLNGQRLTTSTGDGSFVVNYGVGSTFNNAHIVLSDFLANAFLPGDFDQDGDVDGDDFLRWQRNDGSATGLANWQANYGNPTSPLATSQAVPEPATVILLMFGVSAAFLIRRNTVGS